MAGRSIRLFVRTRKRYEPAYFESQLWYIDVTDFAGCSVGDIKRKCHEETSAKVEDLFYLNQSLADDRSVAHHNFPNGAILETTSNPLWAAMIYVKMVEVERERDANPDDRQVQRWTHKSFTKKITLLSVLFNAKKHDNVQPPHFPVYEDFILYLERLGRKSANINPNYSGQDFERWFAEHLQLDTDKPDPIRAFQTRHAARLGLRPNEGQSSGNKQKTSGSSGKVKGKGRQPMKRPTATATRTRPARQQRLCEDCEETLAEIYCQSCLGPGGTPGVVLCMECTHRIHRGALRGNHDCRDISQAPRAPAAPHQYLPHPYKSPFAILLAMTRALKENEHKLSLNEEEIKQRAQPITDTDLHDKPVGKMMGGFDCIENTLIPKNLVQKEAADRHTFALTQSGRELGQKLDLFDQTLQRFVTDAGVPQPPSDFRCRVGERQMILVMDGRERDAARLSALARRVGITVIVRNLQVADYVWVLSPETDGAHYDGSRLDQEIMLPVLVERKSWHDLHDSIRFGRWPTQLNRMKSCGLPLNFVLVEGCLSDLRQVTQERRDFLQTEIERLSVEEGFHVGRTFGWAKSAAWLFWMTHILTDAYRHGLFKRETLLFSELSPRMVRGERERRLGGVARPLTPRGPSCVWEPDRLVAAVFRDNLGEKKMVDIFRQEFPAGHLRQLLVLHSLEIYNKNRQNLLLTALKQAASLENYTQDSVRGVIEDRLMGELKSLVHYDVLGFWILTLQVRQQVCVLRSETEEDHQRLQHWFSQGRQLPKEAEVKENDKRRENKKLAAGDGERGEDGEVVCLTEDFASDSQTEERMLQEALSLSLISSLDTEDQEDNVDTAIPPVWDPTRDDNPRHHEQSEQLTSQPLCESIPRPPDLNLSVAGDARNTQEDPERSRSPLGFSQGDAILIDSQGLDDERAAGMERQDDAILIDSQGLDDERAAGMEREDDAILIDSQGSDDERAAGMEREDDAAQDSWGLGNVATQSGMAESGALTLEPEWRQAGYQPILQEDEALARRLQAEENLKDSMNLKGVERRNPLEREDSAECDQRECDDRTPKDVNRNVLESCGASGQWRNTTTGADGVLDGPVADDSTPSVHFPHSQHTAYASGRFLSSPKKRPAQISSESLSWSVSQSKKFKSQLESDEELARRLQRELDGDRADDNSPLSLEDSHPPSSCGESSSGLASSPKVLQSKVKEENEVVLRLQEKEAAFRLSVDDTGSSQLDDAIHRDSDSLLSDEALARRLQEEEEELIIKSPALNTNTSSPVSKKTVEFTTKTSKDSQKPAKMEASYVESDEELARRLQGEEEQEARRAQTSVQPPMQARQLSMKTDTVSDTLNVSLEEDERLARRLHTDLEGRVSGQARGEKAQGTTLGGHSVFKQESPQTEKKELSDLKWEWEPDVKENAGDGISVKGSATSTPDVAVRPRGSAHDAEWSVVSSQPDPSVFGAPVSESSSATISSNVKCGSCGQKGHNRRFERCPDYYTEKEKKRRDAMEEAHRQRAEERAREAEERQREEQRALARLAVTRNVLQQNKEQMMQQIAAATQECATQFQSQLDDIDRLINSQQRKLKTTPARQRKQ